MFKKNYTTTILAVVQPSYSILIVIITINIYIIFFYHIFRICSLKSGDAESAFTTLCIVLKWKYGNLINTHIHHYNIWCCSGSGKTCHMSAALVPVRFLDSTTDQPFFGDAQYLVEYLLFFKD